MAKRISPRTKLLERHIAFPGEFVAVKHEDGEPKQQKEIRLHSVCSKCRPIRDWLRDTPDKSTALKKPRLFIHHKSGLVLKRSYLQGCHLCALIWQSLVDPDAALAESKRTRTRKMNNTKVHKGAQVEVSLKMEQPVTRWYKKYSIRVSLHARVKLAKTYRKGMSLQVRWTPDEAQAQLSTGSPSNTEDLVIDSRTTSAPCTSSEVVFGEASRWLADCLSSHEACNRPQVPSILPSRLLRISVEGNIRSISVVSRADFPLPLKYAALSYCWGGSSVYKLEQSTVDALAKGIPASILPKTLQDAIQLADKFSIQWIWIDSLCIKQDSPEDWKHESSLMSHIYGNAFICFAATAGSHSAAGMYCQRDPLSYHPLRIASRTDAGEYHILPHNKNGQLGSCFLDAPLQKRGWVVQERLLSPRTIHIGTMLLWECREQSKAETGVATMKWVSSKRNFCSSVTGTLQSPSTREQEVALHKAWRSLRLEYSECHLSFPTDRLAAFQGIIETLAAQSGWKNYAGMWEPFMIEDLLWHSPYRVQRVPALSGPSWSWVALTGCAFDTVEYDGRKLASSTRVYQTFSQGQTEHLALELSCLKVRLAVDSSSNPAKLCCIDVFDRRWHKPSGNADLEGSEPAEYFLPLMEFKYYIGGIGIRRSKVVAGAYERAGYYDIDNPNGEPLPGIFADKDQYQVVTLV